MTTLYIFTLGKTPGLAVAEVFSRYPDIELIYLDPEVMLVDMKQDIEDSQKLLDTLGGTIKISKVVLTTEPLKKEALANQLADILKSKFANLEGKLNFGLSVYGLGFAQQLTLEVKKLLRRADLSVRAIIGKAPVLSSVEVRKEKLLTEKGTEILVLKTNDLIYLAETVAVQDFESYSLRDYEKPFRDMQMGMLPPKLAQILISLAIGTQAGARIYDPFCGSGTILMEGLLQGSPVSGSDLDLAATEGSLENSTWLINKFKLDSSQPRIQTGDARSFTEFFVRPSDPMLIVTEGPLGPPQLAYPDEATRDEIYRDLQRIYIDFLAEASQTLRSGEKICMCVPFFQGKSPAESAYFPDFAALAESAGFSSLDYADLALQKFGNSIKSNSKNLSYIRVGQVVGREVWVLVKI